MTAHSMKNPHYLGVFLFILLVCQPVHAQPAPEPPHDEALKQRFLREAPAKWREYLRLAQMLQGKMTFHWLENPKGPEVAAIEYKTNGKGRVAQYEKKSRKEAEKNGRDKDVYGANPRYAFHLQRGKPDSPWTVTELIDLSRESLPETWRLWFEDSFGLEATQLVRLNNQFLSDIVEGQDFKVESCRARQQDGQELVEVSFTYDRRAGPGQREGPLKGILLLDPNRLWCLRAIDYKATYKNDSRYKYGTETEHFAELQQTSGALPVPTLVQTDRWFFRDADQKDRILTRTEFELEVPDRLPSDEEFTLTAFGLPEPPGLEWKKPTPWYLWLGFAAIGCLITGVAIRMLGRRSGASQ